MSDRGHPAASETELHSDPGLTPDLRRIALDLVSHEADADDVVQDVLLESLGRESKGILDPESWLREETARAARRLSRHKRRARQSEQHVADRGHAPSAAETIAARDLETIVTRVVGGLPPRAARVFRLRYDEGLKLREIATRMNLPEGTVKTDHALAIRRLRGRFDDEFGERRAWALALLVRLRREPAAARVLGAAAAPAGLGLHVGLKLALIATAGVALFLLVRGGDGGERKALRAAEKSAAESELAALETPENAAPAPVPETSESEAVLSPETPAEPDPAEQPPGPPRVRIHVRDFEGRSLEGIRIAVIGEGGRPGRVGATHEDGVLEFDVRDNELRDGSILLQPVGAGWALPGQYLARCVPGETTEVHVELVDRSVDLAGRVLDRAGDPIEGAVVVLDPHSYLPAARTERVAWHPQQLKARTDASGTFDLPKMRPGRLEFLVVAPGFQSMRAVRGVPPVAKHELQEAFVMEPAATVTGIVKDGDGEPVAGARVWSEVIDNWPLARPARTGPDGSFFLDALPPGSQVLWAQGPPGSEGLVASVSIEAAASGTPAVWEPTLIAATFGTFEFTGAEGEPLAGWRVVAHPVDRARPWYEKLETDADGRVTLWRAPGEPVRVKILPRDDRWGGTGLPVHSLTVDAPFDGVRRVEVDARATHGSEVRASLVRPEGGWPAGLYLALESHDHQFVTRLQFDRAKGQLRMVGVPPGSYALRAGSDQGEEAAFLQFGVASEEIVDLGAVESAIWSPRARANPQALEDVVSPGSDASH